MAPFDTGLGEDRTDMKRLMLLVVLGIVATHWLRTPSGAAPQRRADGREQVDGIPVPIYPGTRVTEAEVQPPRALPRPDHPSSEPVEVRPPRRKPQPLPAGQRAVAGRLSATEERAQTDARLQLRREVAEWIAPDVPAHWSPPAELIDAMIVETRIKPVVRDYGPLYEATLVVDVSPGRRAAIVEAYHRELVGRRLMILAGILGFILICLAALSGYIRADEATKGYYTNWLRAVAAAGVGASGVLIYQILT
jgi:hypothetical protein